MNVWGPVRVMQAGKSKHLFGMWYELHNSTAIHEKEQKRACDYSEVYDSINLTKLQRYSKDLTLIKLQIIIL